MCIEKTFLDLICSGEALPAEIDDYINMWYFKDPNLNPDCSLKDYLGFNEEEYFEWLTNPEVLKRRILKNIVMNMILKLLNIIFK